MERKRILLKIKYRHINVIILKELDNFKFFGLNINNLCDIQYGYPSKSIYIISRHWVR